MERDKKLAVFPCGTSISENVTYRLYYEPLLRRCKQNQYIGIYTKKNVAYVGTVKTIAVCSYKNDVPNFTEEEGHLTDDQRRRIIETIGQTPYYNLKANPHRFYLVDAFISTNCEKTSRGGIMGFRYLDLSMLVPAFDSKNNYSTEDLAKLLEGKTWT